MLYLLRNEEMGAILCSIVFVIVGFALQRKKIVSLNAEIKMINSLLDKSFEHLESIRKMRDIEIHTAQQRFDIIHERLNRLDNEQYRLDEQIAKIGYEQLIYAEENYVDGRFNLIDRKIESICIPFQKNANSSIQYLHLDYSNITLSLLFERISIELDNPTNSNRMWIDYCSDAYEIYPELFNQLYKINKITLNFNNFHLNKNINKIETVLNYIISNNNDIIMDINLLSGLIPEPILECVLRTFRGYIEGYSETFTKFSEFNLTINPQNTSFTEITTLKQFLMEHNIQSNLC